MDHRNKRIYVAGSSGMVGRAIVGELNRQGFRDPILRTHDDLDLTNQQKVESFFAEERPEIVIIAAAKVGGILANDTYRAEFLYDNLMIEANLIHASYTHQVEKLIFLGSSCIYPKFAPQPMKEEYLLSGPLESTNEPYAIAKIAGIKLCENYYRQYDCNFISVMPTNLYGPFDNFDLHSSHVIPGLMRKFHTAKTTASDEVVVWGSGTPLREFLYVGDLAEAIVFLLENLDAGDLYAKGITHINVGSGTEIPIDGLAKVIKEIVGFEGAIRFDAEKPDGTPRKLLDVARLVQMGWESKTLLKEGLELTYDWYVNHCQQKLDS